MNSNCYLPSSSGTVQAAVGLSQTVSKSSVLRDNSNTPSSTNSFSRTPLFNIPQCSPSRRLFIELSHLNKTSLPGCHAFPSSESIFKWSVVLQGPPDTVYTTGIFFVELIFGVNYPFIPPEVIFRTKIYHCNINSQGQVCMGLKQNWSSSMGVVDVLKMLISLFYSCNPHNSLVPHIANQYIHQFEEFEKVARIWTKRFSS